MPVLLVTGFGPFPTMPRNPSAALARRVAADPRWRRLGVEAKGRVLTTRYLALLTELAPALAEMPDAVLMIGVAGRSRGVRIERRATGRRSPFLPDAEGRRGRIAPIAGEDVARRTAAPVAIALQMLAGQRLPCRLSRDAGRYLCNAAYFQALAEPMPALFVHIPKPPRADRRVRGERERHRVDWNERLARALVDIGLVLLRQARAAQQARVDAAGKLS